MAYGYGTIWPGDVRDLVAAADGVGGCWEVPEKPVTIQDRAFRAYTSPPVGMEPGLETTNYYYPPNPNVRRGHNAKCGGLSTGGRRSEREAVRGGSDIGAGGIRRRLTRAVGSRSMRKIPCELPSEMRTWWWMRWTNDEPGAKLWE